MNAQYPPTPAQISLERLWETQRERDLKIITEQEEVIEVHSEIVCKGCPRLAEHIQATCENGLSVCMPTVVLWELVAYLYGFDFSYDFGEPDNAVEDLCDSFVAARKAESAVCDLIRGYDRVQCFCFGASLFSDPDMDIVAVGAMDLAVRLTAANLDSITAEESEEILRNHFPYRQDIAEDFAAHVSEYAAAMSLASRIEQIHMA
ncbi:hypothetical protein CB0940_10264 [Cercospora beticola]|uniref:Uncharacterized protein n=1 Tax=Cercospora beticola TaxID=122368 RepID=A0A2G5HUZ5_CERBT|nr:hypothetical protein CB0940_10264 [Cercospora beticola]PIA96359.1 hypothetical protein CB0940_10264 [Cercospora beticola]WPB06971.1 hypothetical protein RHO25_011631 [Cercospora beticola]